MIFSKQEFHGDVRGTASNIAIIKIKDQSADNIVTNTKLVSKSTSDGTPNTLVKRDEIGSFTANQIKIAGTPINDNHSATKAYVDSAINHILEQINSITNNQTIQLATPINGGAVNVNSDTKILILKNTNNISGYTINFPANPADGQLFTILLGTSNNVTGIVSATTDGSSIINSVTSLTPTDLIITDGGASVSYLYSSDANTWYRCQRG